MRRCGREQVTRPLERIGSARSQSPRLHTVGRIRTRSRAVYSFHRVHAAGCRLAVEPRPGSQWQRAEKEFGIALWSACTHSEIGSSTASKRFRFRRRKGRRRVHRSCLETVLPILQSYSTDCRRQVAKLPIWSRGMGLEVRMRIQLQRRSDL